MNDVDDQVGSAIPEDSQEVHAFDLKRKECLAVAIMLAAAVAARAGSPAPSGATMLGIRGTEFTLYGKPTFLLGLSYFGALGAPRAAVRQDLDDAQRLGFNWLRVWATWDAFGHNVSAVGADGAPREPFLGNLKWLVAECDRRGLVVDVTLTRGGTLSDFAGHQRAMETLTEALRTRRNWYLDLANEHDVRDSRYVSDAELKRLRDLVRRLDPRCLVTASFGGHDLTANDVTNALLTVGLDFLAPHRPRTAQSPGETEVRTRALRALMHKLGCEAPILYQEPFRRGYSAWEPRAEDFLTDLKGARAGGAAGWCFHNGQQRDAPDHRPRRSFDLRNARLFDQLDAVEQIVVRQAADEIKGERGIR